jgi:large subunit ribosomal protein L10
VLSGQTPLNRVDCPQLVKRLQEVTNGAHLEQKKAVVAEVAEVAAKALAAVAAEYRGLTVEEMTDLRVKARKSGVYVKVAKNTLVRRAVAETEYECMQEALTGAVLLAYSIVVRGAAGRLVLD